MENQEAAGSEKAHPTPLPSKEESSLPPSGGDYVPYPKIDPRDLEPHHAPQTFSSGTNAAAQTPTTTMPSNSNPYTTSSPAAPKIADSVRGALGQFKIKVGEAAKTTEDLAGNVWQHLKTGPSMADAAMGMITEGTKVIAEGGYEKIFQKTFDTIPGEKLKTNYACFLSTSAGPVRGIIYLSTAKIAFTSDNPLSYKVGDKTEWSYYKLTGGQKQEAKTNSNSDNEMEGIQNTTPPHDSHGIPITYHEGVTSTPITEGCHSDNVSSKGYIIENNNTKDEISDDNDSYPEEVYKKDDEDMVA